MRSSGVPGVRVAQGTSERFRRVRAAPDVRGGGFGDVDEVEGVGDLDPAPGADHLGVFDRVVARRDGQDDFGHGVGEVGPERFEVVADPAGLAPPQEGVERDRDEHADAGDDPGGRDSDDVDGGQDGRGLAGQVADGHLQGRGQGRDGGQRGADPDADQAQRPGAVAVGEGMPAAGAGDGDQAVDEVGREGDPVEHGGAVVGVRAGEGAAGGSVVNVGHGEQDGHRHRDGAEQDRVADDDASVRCPWRTAYRNSRVK